MKSGLSRRLAVLSASTAVAAGLIVAGATSAHATAPVWEPTAESVGTITFYDAAGAVITSGSTSTAPFAAYAVGSATVRAGDVQAQLLFANPDHTSIPGAWFKANVGLYTPYPLSTGPANIKTLSNTHPVVAGSGADLTPDAFESAVTIDPTAGYMNVIHVRLRTANSANQPTATYDDADILVNPAAHTWSQIYPATNSAPGAPTGVSGVAGDTQATVSWTAPASNGGSAITGYNIQYSSDGGTTWTDASATFHTSTLTTQTVTGLTNGTGYIFHVAAINSVGTGAYSSPSSTVTPVATVAGTFVATAPTRLLDTRHNVGASGPIMSHGTVFLQVTSPGGLVPTGASAVVLNVTVTAPTQPGNITVYPDGPRPNASNLNFVAGQTIPNLVVAPIAGNGKVDLYNASAGSVQLIADVSGYFTGGTPSVPGAFASTAPTRLMDTRHNVGVSGPVLAHSTVKLPVITAGGVVPAGATAAVLNVTVTAPTQPGNITVYPDGNSQPNASNLNFVAGQTIPNLVVAPIGGDGKVDFVNASAGTVQLLADVSGYFLGGGTPSAAGAFVATTPTRLLDTRHNVGWSGPVLAHGTVMLGINGVSPLPAGVTAVVLNVTVTAPQQAGNITVYPGVTTRPNASNLNFVAGQTIPNLVIAPVGSDGKVYLYNSSGGTVQLIADVSGYLK